METKLVYTQLCVIEKCHRYPDCRKQCSQQTQFTTYNECFVDEPYNICIGQRKKYCR